MSHKGWYNSRIYREVSKSPAILGTEHIALSGLTFSSVHAAIETGDTIPELSIPPILMPILMVSILGSWQD